MTRRRRDSARMSPLEGGRFRHHLSSSTSALLSCRCKVVKPSLLRSLSETQLHIPWHSFRTLEGLLFLGVVNLLLAAVSAQDCPPGSPACGLYCCATGQICSAGHCAAAPPPPPSCSPPQLLCNGALPCVNSYTDVSASFSYPLFLCILLKTKQLIVPQIGNKENNCGGCGKKCGAGETCQGGTCACSGPLGTSVSSRSR